MLRQFLAQDVTKLRRVLSEVGAHAATDDDDIGLGDRDNHQKATADPVGNLVPGTFAGDVVGVFAIRPVDGTAGGKRFPLADAPVVLDHSSATFAVTQPVVDMAVGRETGADTSADGDIERRDWDGAQDAGFSQSGEVSVVFDQDRRTGEIGGK